MDLYTINCEVEVVHVLEGAIDRCFATAGSGSRPATP